MPVSEASLLFAALSRDVWAVTSRDGDRRGGLLATWLLPASLDADAPTAVLGLSPDCHTAALVDRSEAFVAHVLAPFQAEQALRLALTSGANVPDKLREWRVTESATGSPRLVDCQGWMDCRVYARQDVGSRILYWADVIDARSPAEGAPLLNDQQLLDAATADQKAKLREDRIRVVRRHAAAERAWRDSMRRH